MKNSVDMNATSVLTELDEQELKSVNGGCLGPNFSGCNVGYAADPYATGYAADPCAAAYGYQASPCAAAYGYEYGGLLGLPLSLGLGFHFGWHHHHHQG